MSYLVLKKEDFGKYIDFLKKRFEVIAPVKKQSHHVLEVIDDANEIDLNYINTYNSVKKFIFPHKEDLFNFDDGNVKEVIDNKKRVIFGVRPCDVNALLYLDKFFLQDFKDEYYFRRRENTYLIAFVCNKAGENCFCTSMGTDKLIEGYDISFIDFETAFLVEVATERGKNLINGLFKEMEIEPSIKEECNKVLNMEAVDKLTVSSRIYDREERRCLNCCVCEVVCPTCVCFSLIDYINLDLKSGKRKRAWDFCLLSEYTRVAGNFIFRKDKRFRHRIACKFIYSFKNFSEYGCVGCGRCIDYCPANIDHVKMINRLKNEE